MPSNAPTPSRSGVDLIGNLQGRLTSLETTLRTIFQTMTAAQAEAIRPTGPILVYVPEGIGGNHVFLCIGESRFVLG